MRTANKDRKAAMLSIRTSSELRTKLQMALESSGRTLTQEVEMRLERSFSSEEFVGGERTAAFLNLLGATIREIEANTGKSWLEDETTFEEVGSEFAGLFAARRPGTSARSMTPSVKEKPDPSGSD